jgi:hypothetical protein
MPSYLFPSILITLNLCAAGAYLYGGDWKRCVYWCAAAVLTACVTF